jgi:hypothetical protein
VTQMGLGLGIFQERSVLKSETVAGKCHPHIDDVLYATAVNLKDWQGHFSISLVQDVFILREKIVVFVRICTNQEPVAKVETKKQKMH